jgi:hypothetical protein
MLHKPDKDTLRPAHAQCFCERASSMQMAGPTTLTHTSASTRNMKSLQRRAATARTEGAKRSQVTSVWWSNHIFRSHPMFKCFPRALGLEFCLVSVGRACVGGRWQNAAKSFLGKAVGHCAREVCRACKFCNSLQAASCVACFVARHCQPEDLYLPGCDVLQHQVGWFGGLVGWLVGWLVG